MSRGLRRVPWASSLDRTAAWDAREAREERAAVLSRKARTFESRFRNGDIKSAARRRKEGRSPRKSALILDSLSATPRRDPKGCRMSAARYATFFPPGDPSTPREGKVEGRRRGGMGPARGQDEDSLRGSEGAMVDDEAPLVSFRFLIRTSFGTLGFK
ncbi:hypothetical protein KM043_008278 [Ampulex compressa]|nr:hypothetical protein KM043_008278 [Ampulex compressa]